MAPSVKCFATQAFRPQFKPQHPYSPSTREAGTGRPEDEWLASLAELFWFREQLFQKTKSGELSTMSPVFNPNSKVEAVSSLEFQASQDNM